MKTSRPHLKQIDPPATFEIVDPSQNRWQVSIRDATDSYQDSVWFACPLGKWEIADLIKAGGRECQNGEGIVIVTKLVKGLPVELWTGRVIYAWGNWHWQAPRAG